MKQYAVIVIGAGAGGLVVAIGAAKAGKKVLLIERGQWGGDCTNFGCIPSKTLIAAAKHGMDGTAALRHVREVVTGIRHHEEPPALEKLGVTVACGTASFASPNEILVTQSDGTEERVYGKRIIIATGSHPLIPSIVGLEGTPYLTNETIFSCEELPPSLAVLGGGPIGCELAYAFQRLGTEVHLLHKREQLLNREPPDVSHVLTGAFEHCGMHLHLGVVPEAVSYNNGFSLQLTNGETLRTTHFLVAVGRRPNLAALTLEKAGIKVGEHGITVDRYGRSSQKHVYALGDATGPPFFTHLAENRARTVLTNILLAPFWKTKLETQAVPRVTFTIPEVASIGLSEQDAIEKYGAKRLAVYTVPFTELDRAITDGETEGFVTIVTKKLSSTILGATIVCSRAGEMLPEIGLAMQHGIPLRKLASLIHAYPTFSLAIRKCADRWLTQTILPLFRGKR